MTGRKKQNQKGRNLTIEQLNQRLLLDAAGFVEPVFYSPTPYLSEADTPDGFIPNPACSQCVVGLETFEDGQLDPKITISEGQIIGPGFHTGLERLTDSVDGDDGVIDGTGETGSGGWSYFTGGNSLTIRLSSLMQSMGVVWTDGDVSLTDVIFEGFDQDGDSLGTINAGDIADDSLMATTAEDRFFGVSFGNGVTTGVTAIKITNVGGNGLEIDHIQYANCSDCCDVDLELNKTVDSSFLAGGVGGESKVQYTITVTNRGQLDATGVEVTDQLALPAGVLFASASVSAGQANISSTGGTWTIDNVPAGTSETLTILLDVSSDAADGAVITNQAGISAVNETDSNVSNNVADANLTIVRGVDIAVAKTALVPTVVAGSDGGQHNVRFTVTVTNEGSADATGVAVTDTLTLPAGVSFSSASISAGTESISNNGGTWVIGSLPVGASEVLTVLLNVSSNAARGTTIRNHAALSAVHEGDANNTNNAASVEVQIELFETELRLDNAGNLVIEDINGGVSKDTLTVQSDEANGRFVITDPNNTLTTSIPGATMPDANTSHVPFASVPGNLVLFNTLAEDDNVTIDFSLGNFTKGITYDGGTLPSGDTLEFRGGGPFAATFDYIDPSTGSIDITGNGTISYSGLDQISSMLDLTDAILNFSDAADVITISDAGTASQTTVDSTLSARTTLTNPSSSLRIDAGAGNDTIDINGLGTEFAAALTVDGSDGIDRIRINSSLNLRNDLSVMGAATVAMKPGTTVDVGNGDIFVSARWGIVVSRLVTSATVRLESVEGGIADTGVADRPHIQATSAVIRAATSVGAAGHKLGTQIGALDAVANGAGIFIENDGALEIECAKALNIVVDITKPSPLAIAGDIDDNGIVDFADFLTLSTSFGKIATHRSDGDLNDDGEVSFADFLILSANFGNKRRNAELVLPAENQDRAAATDDLFAQYADASGEEDVAESLGTSFDDGFLVGPT